MLAEPGTPGAGIMVEPSCPKLRHPTATATIPSSVTSGSSGPGSSPARVGRRSERHHDLRRSRRRARLRDALDGAGHASADGGRAAHLRADRPRDWSRPCGRDSRALSASAALRRLSSAAGRQRLQHRGGSRGHGGRDPDAHRRAVTAVDPRLRGGHSPGHRVPELRALRPVPQVADRGAAARTFWRRSWPGPTGGGSPSPPSPRASSGTRTYITTLVGVLGTTISPYLFFWQASHEVEAGEGTEAGGPWPSVAARRRTSWPTRASTSSPACSSRTSRCFSSCSRRPRPCIRPAGPRSRPRARPPRRLRPLAGDLAYVLFALGLIGTGLLAVPVLAGSASFAVAEVFRLALGARSHAAARAALLSGLRRGRGRGDAAGPRRDEPDAHALSLRRSQRAPGPAAAPARHAGRPQSRHHGRARERPLARTGSAGRRRPSCRSRPSRILRDGAGEGARVVRDRLVLQTDRRVSRSRSSSSSATWYVGRRPGADGPPGRGGIAAARQRLSERDERRAADRRLRVHPSPARHRAQGVHGLGAPGLDPLPRLVRHLPFARRLSRPFEGQGWIRARLLSAARLAHRPGRGHRARWRSSPSIARSRELRPSQCGSPAGRFPIWLYVSGDRRARVLDALSTVRRCRGERHGTVPVSRADRGRRGHRAALPLDRPPPSGAPHRARGTWASSRPAHTRTP